MRKTFLCMIFLIISSMPTFAENIKIGSDEWCPYICKSDAERPGILIEITKYALEKKGHTVDYIILPWARAIHLARIGKLTGIIGAFKSDVPDFIFPEREQGVSQNCFYINKNSKWQYKNIELLTSSILGVINQYSYGDLIDSYIDKPQNKSRIITISGTQALQKRLVKLLLTGRVEAIVASSAVMDYFLKQNNQTRLVKKVNCIDKPEKIYIAFSPSNPNSNEFAQLLSSSVQELRSSGKLKTILDYYGVEDWQ